LGTELQALTRRLGEIERRIDDGSASDQTATAAFEASQLACTGVERVLRAEIDTAVHTARAHTEAASSVAELNAIRVAQRHAEAAVAVLREEILGELARLRRSLAAARSSVRSPDVPATATATSTATSTATARASEPDLDEAFYVDLEDRFRGAPDDIRARQRVYVEVVADVAGDDRPVLDLGFGRGEWLDVLRDAGVPARGVDSNQVSVDEARERGLDVSCGDLVECVRGAPDSSYGAVTMFQVVEHLPFNVLVEVMEQCARVLVPGGVLFVETPNALNLRVAATTFWLDPTHVRPLHPELLEFIAKRCGFSETRSMFEHPLARITPFEDVPPDLARWLQRVSELIDGPGDFALVARTPGTEAERVAEHAASRPTGA
jgi:SAM-dependent methyltransferase